MNNADLMNASMDDIVFEGRNKAYGSYVMRKLYNKRLLIGTIGGVILFLFICFLPVIAGVLSNMLAPEDKEMDMTEVILDQPPPIDPNEPPPPPPPPPVEPPPPVAQIRFVPPVVKEDKEVIEEEPPPTEEELKEEKAISNVDAEGDKAKVEAASNSFNKIVTIVVTAPLSMPARLAVRTLSTKKTSSNPSAAKPTAPTKPKAIVPNTKNIPPVSKGVTAPKGWETKASDKGGGTVFQDPQNPHNTIRQMPGNPTSTNPAQRSPYVKYMKDGKAGGGTKKAKVAKKKTDK